MLPAVAYAVINQLAFEKTRGRFADRFNNVPVFQVTGGRNNFSAFVYMCRLNLDLDGAANTYGYDNAAKGSIQHNLKPLESWHLGQKGVSNATSQKVGLGNACGDPGDGSKGWKNFLEGNRNFYWAGIKAVSKGQAQALKLMIDERPELEAGLDTYARNGKPQLQPVGLGYFPVIQPDTGYYISGTSVVADGSLSRYNAHRYLDSSEVPYAVWANHWNTISIGGKKVRQGDVGLAIANATGASTPFVYGDSGTPNKVGESSLQLHKTLGNPGGLVTFIAFPGSGSGSVLGPNPNLIIRARVLMHTIKLQKNASDLASRLSMGPELAAPQASGADAKRAGLYKNFMSALSNWTMAS